MYNKIPARDFPKRIPWFSKTETFGAQNKYRVFDLYVILEKYTYIRHTYTYIIIYSTLCWCRIWDHSLFKSVEDT